MTKVVFMGEKPLAKKCLQYLRRLKDVEILGVCTRKPTKNVWWGEQVVRKYCIAKGIPIIERKKILEFEEVDVIISVLYPFVIEKEILDKAKIAAVNLHQAPLPHYKGCNSVSHAIMNGEKEYGVTLHLMNEELDSGDIIERKMFPINDDITARELYELADKYCFEVFRRNIKNILRGEFRTFKQEKHIKSHIYPRNSLQNKQVDLSWPPEKIYNFVRGLDFPPFEKAYIMVGDKKIYLSTRS